MKKIRYSILQINNFALDEERVSAFLEEHKKEILETGYIADVIIKKTAKHPLLGSLLKHPCFITIFVVPKSNEDLVKYDTGPRPGIKTKFEEELIKTRHPKVNFIDVGEIDIPCQIIEATAY